MQPYTRLVWVLILSLPVVLLGLHAGKQLKSEILLADAGKLLRSQSGSYAYDKAASAALLNSRAPEYRRAQYYAAYRQRNFTLALQHAREQVELSPADAISWLRLAVVKTRLQQFDNEFEHALERAYRYATHLDFQQLRIARLGAEQWPQLSASSQLIIAQSFIYILQHQYRYRFIAYLFDTQRESLICPGFAKTEELLGWCERTAKLREICSHRHGNAELVNWCAKRGIGRPE